MGNDFESNSKYNIEINVKLIIKANKSCYFPGEIIEGNLKLIPKKILKDPIFRKPNIQFNVSQYELYTYYEHYADNTSCKKNCERELLLFSKTIFFDNFQNTDISNGIKIPFSIQIPLKILPSLNFENSKTRHFFTVYIPYFYAKKTVCIVIKNIQLFSYSNHLLKIPTIVNKNYEKTKGIFGFKAKKVNCCFKLEKNAFCFNEAISFDIKLDCSILKVQINRIEISIRKFYKKMHSSNIKKLREEKKECVIKKIYKIKKNSDYVYDLKSSISLPKDNSYLPKVYSYFDKVSVEDVKNYLERVIITPPSYDGLIIINYFLKIKIVFDSFFTSNDELMIPIDFFSSNECANFQNINNNSNQIKINLNNEVNTFNKIDQNQNSQNDLPSYNEIIVNNTNKPINNKINDNYEVTDNTIDKPVYDNINSINEKIDNNKPENNDINNKYLINSNNSINEDPAPTIASPQECIDYQSKK